MGKRLSYIDSIKGFTMLLVILGHIADGYIGGGLYSTWNQAVFLAWLYEILYSFHMPLFIMISGFLFGMTYNSRNDRRQHLKRQIGNLTILYFVYSIVLILVKSVLESHVNQPLNLMDILLLWGRTVKPYWYLYVLILFYLTFSIPAVKKAPVRLLLPVTAVLCAVSGWVPVHWFELHHYLYLLFFFYLGILFYQKQLPLLDQPRIIFPLFGVSILLQILLRKYPTHYNEIPIAAGLIAFGYILLLWYLFRKIRFLSGSRLFAYLGSRSLELYVLHCYFTAGFRELFQFAGIDQFAFCLIANMILSTILPLLFAWLMAKIGLHDLFFRPVSFFSRIRRPKD